MPHIDPQTVESYGPGGYTLFDGDAWADLPGRLGADVEHVFDAAEFAGRLFCCGTTGGAEFGDLGNPTVWASADDGDTWTQAVVVPDTIAGELVRFYAMAIVGGELVAVSSSASTTTPPGGRYVARTADGVAWTVQERFDLPGSWSSGPGPGRAWDGGRLLTDRAPYGADSLGRLWHWTGADVAPTSLGPARGFDIGDDGDLYVLTVDSIVSRTAHDADPQTRASIANPHSATGLAVLPGSEQAVIGRVARLQLIDLA